MRGQRTKLKRKPAKQARLATRAQERTARARLHDRLDEVMAEPMIRYLTAQGWAWEREQGLFPEYEGSVVCETCGLEQPYWQGSRCASEGLLGIPCEGEVVITAEHHLEIA